MIRANGELTTEDWKRVFTQARELGVLQLGLSGGEPLVRSDVEELAAHAHTLGLYTTLVTSGVGLTRRRAEKLREAGLEHIQISIQDSNHAVADQIAGMSAVPQKFSAAAIVRELGFAFSINVVLHRANIDRVDEMIELAASLGADRLELANTQYYGWALENRNALMPTPAQVTAAADVAEEAMRRHRGRMQILYVLPDYHESYPKPCYGDGADITWWWYRTAGRFPVTAPHILRPYASTAFGITRSAGSGRSRPLSKLFAARRGCRNPVGRVRGRRSILEDVAARHLP